MIRRSGESEEWEIDRLRDGRDGRASWRGYPEEKSVGVEKSLRKQTHPVLSRGIRANDSAGMGDVMEGIIRHSDG